MLRLVLRLGMFHMQVTALLLKFNANMSTVIRSVSAPPA
jgi:hypothetical protein